MRKKELQYLDTWLKDILSKQIANSDNDVKEWTCHKICSFLRQPLDTIITVLLTPPENPSFVFNAIAQFCLKITPEELREIITERNQNVSNTKKSCIR